MKVRYIKDFPDPSVAPDFVYKNGWTAEHEDHVAQQRIAEGFCVEEHKETRARRLEPVAMVEMECIPEKSKKDK